jgi:hypothetical protein
MEKERQTKREIDRLGWKGKLNLQEKVLYSSSQ